MANMTTNKQSQIKLVKLNDRCILQLPPSSYVSVDLVSNRGISIIFTRYQIKKLQERLGQIIVTQKAPKYTTGIMECKK